MLYHSLTPHTRPLFSVALKQRVSLFLREILSVGILACAFCFLCCLISYDSSDPSWNTATEGPIHNMCGITGSYVADFCFQLWGLSSYVYALDLFFLGVLLTSDRWRWFDLFVGWLHVCVLSVLMGCGIHHGILSHAVYGGAWGQTLAFFAFQSLSKLFSSTMAGTLFSCVMVLVFVKLTLTVGGIRGNLWRSQTWAFVNVGNKRGYLRWVQWFRTKCTPPPSFWVQSSQTDIVSLVQKEQTLDVAPSIAQTSVPQASLYRKIKSVVKNATPLQALTAYELPPLEFLSPSPPQIFDARTHTKEAHEKAKLLEEVLKEFGVLGHIVQIRPGPVVTLYELRPAPGTKSSRVISLADDIARSMCALSARVAAVPGRNVIGIELPNSHRETVFIRDIISSKSYEESQASLALILGKDIGGDVVIADLARMPHLLVAGTTGSGKSVAVNSMILSLLYRMSPHDCKFIMIDPKMLELSIYDGIPHLLTPVVTDPKKAIVALRWVVKEMENRYRAMSQLSVRNIEGYNQRLREAAQKNEILKKTVQTGFDPESGDPIFEDQIFNHQTLPYIVVVVDEMADLMLVAGKEIEAAVQRLAQMARAAGIHIIMATQRPSVDVITGTIKANFPTRMSFQVTSKIDSRTILGEQGAEQLLGQGDMLYMASGGRIVRLHGPYVHDTDVERVVSFLRSQGEPDYIQNLTEDEGEAAANPSGQGDDLYYQAVTLVRTEGKASTSFIQRHFQIGYNRAARVMEQMEKEGVVTPANHAGKREIIG